MGKGEPGDGAGVGGGSGGTIRDAGGAFGKREAAQEEQYFRKLVCYYCVLLIFNILHCFSIA